MQGLVQLAAALALYRFGLYVMFSAYVVINIAWLLVWHAMTRRTLRVTLLNALHDIMPFAVIATGAMAIAHFASAIATSIYAVLVIKILVAATVYTGTMYLTGATTFRECVSYILKKRP